MKTKIIIETRIDVCVCTFRRPQVVETLRSLAGLQLKPGWLLRVVVADNNDEPMAMPLVEQAAAETGLDIHYIHAPARNISVARNACLDAATAPYVAFIDDDELASRRWLIELMKAMEKDYAEIAIGPVHASYAASAPEWLKRCDFHSAYPLALNGRIRSAASNNVLMRIDSPVFRNLRFRIDLGRSGGEDTVFFAAAYRAGATIAYAPTAIVTETVPENRAKFRWVFRRRFRYGQTHGTLLLSMHGAKISTRLSNFLLAAAKCVACFCIVPFHLGSRDKIMFWTLRGALHAGVVARLSGQQELESYG